MNEALARMTELGLGDRTSAKSALELLAGDTSLDAPTRSRIGKAAREALQ